MELIRELIERETADYGDLAAVEWVVKKEVHTRKYKDLMENIKNIRINLHSQGFDRKQLSIIGYSSVEWIEVFLGIMGGGSVAVPLDVNLTDEDMLDLIIRSDSEGVFLAQKKAGLIPQILEKCPLVRSIWLLCDKEELSVSLPEGQKVSVTTYDELKKPSGKEDLPQPEPGQMAVIIFTSGTTGKSKGVMLSQENLASNLAAINIRSKPGTKMLTVLPIHHAYCLVMDWLRGFANAATMCVNDSLLHLIRNMGIYRPKAILMVPLMIETIEKKLIALEKEGKLSTAEIREKVFGGELVGIFSGGAHLDPSHIERFQKYGVKIMEGYGMSECAPVISTNSYKVSKSGSIGQPLANVRVRFSPEGEIEIKGSSVMMGYYNMPEETAKVLTEDGWLKTGDKGYMDEEGFLYINGRVKNLIILSNGENVSPEELEGKLELFEEIGEVVVMEENDALTAWIYPDPEAVKEKGLDSEEKIREAVQRDVDAFNRTQPGYCWIAKVMLRKYPFARNTTRKILRDRAMIDEPAEKK